MSRIKNALKEFEWWLTNNIICHFPGNRVRTLYLKAIGVKMPWGG